MSLSVIVSIEQTGKKRKKKKKLHTAFFLKKSIDQVFNLSSPNQILGESLLLGVKTCAIRLGSIVSTVPDLMGNYR